MKLFSVLVASSFLTISAFGVSPAQKAGIQKAPVSGLRKDAAATSPLFRDPSLTRGGAVPGWAAYNEALDKNPLPTKAFTSLVGWALGDFLAQVRFSRSSACFPDILYFAHWRVPLVSCSSQPSGIYQRRSIRLEEIHHSFGLWFLVPWTFGPLLLQLP
mmetsp:Transcript_18724/g.43485  ORF Transcript_18724/g.43485 Transcript_18724/m.43485 type:complete len:159 (+) Transcript_18724:65-541(+)